MMAKRTMIFRIKPDYLGKVRLESGLSTIVLDDNTDQGVLAQLYDTVLGKGFIEQVAAPRAAAQTQIADGTVG